MTVFSAVLPRELITLGALALAGLQQQQKQQRLAPTPTPTPTLETFPNFLKS